MKRAPELGRVFIYALCHPDTGQIRYVGKTQQSLQRRLRGHLNEKGTTRKVRWLRKLKVVPDIVVLEEVREGHWQEAEKKWIKHYRDKGVDLTNLTDGGEERSNPSKETREKLSAMRRKEWASPEGRAKWLQVFRDPARCLLISEALTGRTKTKEHVDKLPQNHPGWKHTEAAKQKIRESNEGRRHAPETIQKLREINKGNQHGVGNRSRKGQPVSAEERAKRSQTLRGRPKSEEHRQRIQEGQRKAWARRKAAQNSFREYGAERERPS